MEVLERRQKIRILDRRDKLDRASAAVHSEMRDRPPIRLSKNLRRRAVQSFAHPIRTLR